jgi:hypothetical protein
MSGPPTHAEPSALVAKLAAIPKPSTVVPFPRKDPATGEPVFMIALVPLTEAELMKCRAAAEAYARMMLDDKDKTKTPGDSLGYKDLYVNAIYVELLAIACRDPDPEMKLKVPVFPQGAQEIRQRCFPDEIAVLFEAYSNWQTEAGPIVSHMSEAEMNAWIEVLAKGLSTVPLSALSSEMRNELLIFTARRLQSFLTGSSSSGAPPDESPPTLDGEQPPPKPSADP